MESKTDPIYEDLRRANLLWHYTSWPALQGIIEKNEIWASHIEYLNDSKEYVHGLELIEPVLERNGLGRELENFYKDSKVETYTASFSASFDSLSQWRAYAGSGAGIAIGFDRTKLVELAERHVSHFDRCYYLDQDVNAEDSIPELRAQLEQLNDLRSRVPESTQRNNTARRYGNAAGSTVWGMFPRLAARVKDIGFKEENEYRLIMRKRAGPQSKRFFRTRGSLVVPYLKLRLSEEGSTDPNANPIRGILVGPSVHMGLIKEAVDLLLDPTLYILSAKVSVSRLPFRNW